MKRGYCDCRQGRDQCNCGNEINKPLNRVDWWTLTVVTIGLGLLIHSVALKIVPGW